MEARNIVLNRGRRNTLRKLNKFKASHLANDDITHQNSPVKDKKMSKHDKEKVIKYLWKDIKNNNATRIADFLAETGDAILPKVDAAGSLLLYAVKNRQVNIIEVLLKHQSPIIAHDNESGLTPLHIAVKLEDKAILGAFVDNHISLDKETLYEKRTPLHLAVRLGLLDIVQFLLVNNSDVNCKDIYGSTPLHHAVTRTNVDVAALLLQHGASVDVYDNEGWTPLHTAVVAGQTSAMKLLLNEKANTEAQTKYGKTALHLACCGNDMKVIDILISHNASVNVRDIHNKTPSDYTTNTTIADILKATSGKSYGDIETKKHVAMKTKSKSLADLIDPSFVNDSFHSESDSNVSTLNKSSWLQNRSKSLAVVHEHETVNDEPRQGGWNDDGEDVVFNDSEELLDKEEIALCNSLQSSFRSGLFHLQIHGQSSRKSSVNDITETTDDVTNNNCTELNQNLHLFNSEIDKTDREFKAIHYKITDHYNVGLEQSGHFQTVKKPTLKDMTDKCIASISHIEASIGSISDSGADVGGAIQQLKDYLQLWRSETVQLRNTLNTENLTSS